MHTIYVCVCVRVVRSLLKVQLQLIYHRPLLDSAMPGP